MVSQYSIEKAEAAGCMNFAALVQECAAHLYLDTQRPDTFPHVDSRSFRCATDGNRIFVAYTVRNGFSSQEAGRAIEPTEQLGIWRLL